MSAPSSLASAGSTSDSPELGFDTPSSVSRTLGGEASSPITGPECRSTRTFALSENQRGELLLTDVAHQLTSGGGKPGQGYPCVVTFDGKPLKKLTPEQVIESIRLYEQGLSLGKVADRMGVSRQAMHDLLKRRITLRDRIEALPRKEQTAIRAKRAATSKRYRSRAARITQAQIHEVWERDQVCTICGDEGKEIDHIVPVSRGGQTELTNLRLLCRPCHREKSRTEKGVKPVEASQGSTSFAEASRSRARTSPSPADAPGSQELAQGSSTSSPASLSLFDLDGFSSRTYPDCSPRTAVGTSESCLERWPTSGTAWRGGLSTAVSSECRSDEGGCSSSEPSLSQILEPPQNVPAKYSLSARAAQGILRRAEKRGRTLPSHLSAALDLVARTTTTESRDAS